MRITSKSLGYVAIFVLGLGLGAYAFSYRMESQLASKTERREAGRALYQPASDARAERLHFQPTQKFQSAANKTVDAVVYISTSISDGEGFFSMPGQGSGSGVILSEDGYVITNYHVVEDAVNVRVTLNDKSEYEAELVARDRDTDLAVLKIDAGRDLPAMKFANSDDVVVGQWALAVGNPFSLTSTVTAGIVSAKARNIGVIDRNKYSNYDYSIESFIQTDAAVNPGNSGGALVNLDGELIGVNTAIASETGTFAGYSFAIPANLARKVAADLIEFGVVQRGFIGVTIRDVDSDLADRKDLASLKGVYVERLAANGAAEEAGLERGDVIVGVQGREVNSISELQEQIANYRPGDAVNVAIRRDGVRKEFKVTLRNLEGKTTTVKPRRVFRRSGAVEAYGATYQAASEATLEELDLDYGIEIVDIKKYGKVDKLGLRPGFVITRIDGKPIRSLNDFERALDDDDGVIHLEGYTAEGDKAFHVLRGES